MEHVVWDDAPEHHLWLLDTACQGPQWEQLHWVSEERSQRTDFRIDQAQTMASRLDGTTPCGVWGGDDHDSQCSQLPISQWVGLRCSSLRYEISVDGCTNDRFHHSSVQRNRVASPHDAQLWFGWRKALCRFGRS